MDYLMKEKAVYKKNNILKKSISKDHFIVDSQEEYAGCHIILDLWDAKFNNSINTLRKILKETIKISGATLIHMHFHRFGKEQGISGVAVLAESHISVHTWPERNYVAFDIFMCGDTSPEIGAEHLIKTFNPKRKVVKIIKRGVNKIVK